MIDMQLWDTGVMIIHRR